MTRDAKKQSVTATTEHKHTWAIIDRGIDKPEVSCECGVFPKAGELPRIEAILRLKEWIKPGDTLHTQIKSVSRSGMSRVIQVIKIQCREETDVDGRASREPDILYLGYNVAQATGMSYDRNREGVKVGGCGMDMGFHLVYELSHALFRGGFGCIGKGCPSNDHSNGDRDYTPHVDHATSPDHICARKPETCTAKKHWHNDGGYSLKQRWL